MNSAELTTNPRLTRWFVQNLNRDTKLPSADATAEPRWSACRSSICSSRGGVARGGARPLRPGAPLVISFSNRCFWTKAVAIWRALDDAGHTRLVERYLRHAGFERIETHELAEWVEDISDPMTAVVGPRQSPVGCGGWSFRERKDGIGHIIAAGDIGVRSCDRCASTLRRPKRSATAL